MVEWRSARVARQQLAPSPGGGSVQLARLHFLKQKVLNKSVLEKTRSGVWCSEAGQRSLN